TYLNNNLVSTEVWKNASGTTVNTITYTYNENNQVMTVGDNSGTYTYTYDSLGRVATRQDPLGITLTYTYDAADRLPEIADSKGGIKKYTYDTADRVATITYQDSTSALREDFTYNNRNDLTDVKRYTDLAGTTLESETVYAYDDAGKLTSIT